MKKKLFKKAVIILIIVLIAISLCNFLNFLRTGKQSMEISVNKKYFTDTNLEAIVKLKDRKTDTSKDGKVKVELLNSNGKKVKGTKQEYDVKENEDLVVSIPLIKEIETGNYSLKITATDGLLKDTEEIDVSIMNYKESNVVISLDKGIYKPGDTVNFRAMFLSKKDDTPISEDVTISIYDGNENRVFLEKTKSSEFGIISGKFELADEVNSGEYKIVVSTNSLEQTKIFNVNPYITPTFEAIISTDKDNYLVGETAQISVNTKYFFGEPVKNASITGKINDKEIVGITNENGIYETTYTIEEVGKTNIQLQIVDSSNYLIETEKTILGSTDVFEIEIVPENSNIIKGVDNNFYIFTKQADGTPIKTHTTVRVVNKSKQVITDENGIGKITLTSDDINSLSKYTDYEDEYNYTPVTNKKYEIVFDITSEDMKGNIVSKEQKIILRENNGTVIKTDKIKYSQGDDVKITLNSTTDIQNEKIYVYKNNQLLKMISTDQEEVEFNLEDNYGLIDIYVATEDNNYDSYYDSFSSTNSFKHSKRTIFVKPNKELNIQIETNKEEYKPGEDLNLKFTTTDATDKSVESALLVSILDEAILNLAENDLSVDNIKLALQDLEFVDGITAADVYANILDNEDEQLLMGLLLKQDSNNFNAKTYYSNKNQTVIYTMTKELIKAILPGIIALAIILLYVCITFNKFRNTIIHFINVIVLYKVCYWILDDIVYRLYGFIPIISLVIVLVSYILVLYKKKNEIFKMILELAFIPLIIFGIIAIFANILEYSELAYLILLIIPIVWAILVAISRKNNVNELFKKVQNLLGNITKIEVIYFIVGIIISLLGISNICIIILMSIALYVAFEKKFNKQNIKEEKITINMTPSELLGYICIGVIVIFGLMSMLSGFQTFSGSIVEENNMYDDFSTSMNSSLSAGSFGDTSLKGDIQSPTIGTNGFSSNSFESIDINQFSDIVKEEQLEENEKDESIEEQKKEEQLEENVRNIFLESLAFIPELITTQGIAETTIKISDNITTWNIQTIGNTKDGNVGFATSNFKVFKEFFIDYSLPTNAVVTDKTSIPVTIYNYKDTDLIVYLEVKQNEWCKIGEYTKKVRVSPKSTNMIYVPIEILESGNQTLRIEAKTDNNIQDIVEKSLKITPNGLEKTNVVSSGTIENTFTQDFFVKEDAIENTRKIKVKIYPSMMAQVIEGMENIFKMPTGCFEQTSSALYPNILALKYLEQNQLSNEEIKEKAIEYISKGYQRILSYEVDKEKGGYSLYGRAPAEPVLTAFGLMEISDLSEVYDVEDKVIENMIEYLFEVQKSNGSFDIGSTYIGGASSTNDLAMNAYIIWALSETCPKDNRLEDSIEYLEKNLSQVEDNYTRALIANVFSNVKHSKVGEVIKDLMEQVKTEEETAYISSNIRDYYGTYGSYQNIQTTALTSMVLTKENSNRKTNQSLINYIIEKKDPNGTWETTQSTILALKAINEFNTGEDLSNQTISVKVNNDVKDIEIGENVIDFYELEFENIKDECKIEIEMKKGKLTYEIVEEYYVPYEKVELKEEIKIVQEINSEVKVNDIITQKIHVENLSENTIRNGLIQINIPQGCSTIEESLMQLEYNGIIEKYEYSYGKINLYIRNFNENEFKDIEIQYRAQYPEIVTGASVRVYDYYNPDVEGLVLPVKITVTE